MRSLPFERELGARIVAGVRRKQLSEAAALETWSVVAIDDDEEIAGLGAYIRDGKFSLPIARRMPLREAAEAHQLGALPPARAAAGPVYRSQFSAMRAADTQFPGFLVQIQKTTRNYPKSVRTNHRVPFCSGPQKP
jgi:hypothetical protein